MTISCDHRLTVPAHLLQDRGASMPDPESAWGVYRRAYMLIIGQGMELIGIQINPACRRHEVDLHWNGMLHHSEYKITVYLPMLGQRKPLNSIDDVRSWCEGCGTKEHVSLYHDWRYIQARNSMRQKESER